MIEDRFRLASVLTGLVLLVSGCGDGQGGTAEGPAAPKPQAQIDTVREYKSLRIPDSAPDPVSVSIPDIGIDGKLTKTGLKPDRSLQVPKFGDMSWFAKGTAPGDPGPAAILGHVDTRTGPDVFNRLHELRKGARITVRSEGGKSYPFVVDRVERHRKDKFPTERVWLPTPGPELRLITCGGAFDRKARSYRDNVIVFASLVER